MPAASAGAKAAPAKPTSVPPSKALSASEVLDDVGGDDGDDSEIQRMQAELEATGRGTLQGVDILATLAALEAPDEQIEAQSDDEDDDAKKAVRTASQSKASVVARASTAGSDDSSDEDDDDDGDANAGAQRADLEKLDSAALVALVLKERARANEAKKTIGSLIEQITEYQSAMEEEKAELEKRVKETLAECAALEQLQEKRESEISAFFEKKIDALVSEVEQEKRANSKLSNETISNLQTLMVELQNIEAVNSRLNQELADEREQHARALSQLDDAQASSKSVGDSGETDEAARIRRHKSRGGTRHRTARDGSDSPATDSPLSPRGGSRIMPRPTVAARDLQAAITKGDAKELAALCSTLRDENESLRAALSQRGASDDGAERKLAQIAALIADVQHGLGFAASLDDTPSTPRRTTSMATSAPSAVPAAAGATAAAPASAAPAAATGVSSTASPMATMPALSREALAKAAMDVDPRRVSASSAAVAPSQRSRIRLSTAKDAPATAAAAAPAASDEAAAPKGELMSKMQQLIHTHEETLSLLAKSTGGANTPVGGTLKRGMAGDDMLRLSTRQSFLGASALGLPGDVSAGDLTKKVRAQRRRLGLALSLRDLPEAVGCLLDVDECVWAATTNGHIGMWDKKTHRLTEVRNTGAPAVHQMVRANKETVWGVSGKDSFVYVWSIKNGKMGKKLSGHTSKVTALLVVGKHVWTTSTDMSILVWNAKSFKQVKKIPVTTFLVSMHFHGGRVWMGTESAIMRWDPNTYRPVDVLRAHTKMVTSMVSVSADVVWSASYDRCICAWDGATGALLERFEAHENRVLGLAVAGSVVWSGAADKSIKCWDAKTYGVRRAVMGAHDDAVSCLLHVPASADDVADGQPSDGTVWSGSSDETIGVWLCHHKYDVQPEFDAASMSLAAMLGDEAAASDAERHRFVPCTVSKTQTCIYCNKVVSKNEKAAVHCSDCDKYAHSVCAQRTTSPLGCVKIARKKPRLSVVMSASAAAAMQASIPSSPLAKSAAVAPTSAPGAASAATALAQSVDKKPVSLRREDSKLSRPSVPAPVPSAPSRSKTMRDMSEASASASAAAAGGGAATLTASMAASATSSSGDVSEDSSSSKDRSSARAKGSSRKQRPTTTVIKTESQRDLVKKETRKSLAKEIDPDDGVRLIDDATADAVLLGKADYGTRPAIIAHAVSTRGAADDGEFATITKAWDKPQAQFVKWYGKRAKEEANFKLGSYQLVLVQEEPKIYVANLLVCDDKGALNEAAFLQCVTNLALRAADLDAVIHMAKNDKWGPKEREQQFMALFFRIPRVRVWLHQVKETAATPTATSTTST
jgi:hypothetical protein